MKNNHEELRKLVGERINHLRTERNLSYRQLAQLCNVDHSQISKIEKGLVNVQLDTLSELAGALGVEVKVFFEIGK